MVSLALLCVGASVLVLVCWWVVEGSDLLCYLEDSGLILFASEVYLLSLTYGILISVDYIY